MTTQICIVSERLVPNLIPALMLRPQRVLLVSITEMAERGFAERLRSLLEEKGIEVEVRGGLPSGGLSAIADYAGKLRDDLRRTRASEALVLNLTGGNKLMTIAFSQVLAPVVEKTIYTDTAHERLEELPRPGGSGESVPLSGVLDIPLYLGAQGFRVRGARSHDAQWWGTVSLRRDLTRYLGHEAAALDGFLGAINRLAQRAQNGTGEALVEPRQAFTNPPRGRWAEALRRIRGGGLIRWDEGSSEIELANLEAARYLNGGWLEEYAWLLARELGPDDLALGVEGDWEGTQTGKNELDVVMVHANRLLLMECKTLRLGREDTSDAALLYKLDSVGDDVRGLFGEVVLLSARELSPLIRDRAAHHRIHLVGPDRLGRLQRDIRDWMVDGAFPGT